MILVDTHVLIFDALAPDRLSRKAKQIVTRSRESGALSCSDISLWEIAMLISKHRIQVDCDPTEFIHDVVQALQVKVLPINPEIAVMAQSEEFLHADPADRLIASTALFHDCELVTADTNLRTVPALKTTW